MPSDAPALALVIFGGVAVYAVVTHKRIIDVLLMRPSTLPDTNPSDTSVGGTGAYGSVRDAICGNARLACQQPPGTYEYAEVRPYPPSLFAGPTPRRTDCSGFAILCYKASGALDPNGTNYNGQGYTGSLLARGKRTDSPQPGDLCFWSVPDHVAVFLGGGEIAEFGGGSSPVTSTVEAETAYHAGFLGYRSYL